MSITIGSNILSLRAQRQLTQATNELSTVYERLSSGQRINKASDDAAGLAIVSKLRADKGIYAQGVRNLNDGIGLINIADGAIESLTNIVVRLKELAAQSANGVYSSKQREALDSEAQSLAKEFSRITRGTKFNGSYLFYAEKGEVRLQGGYGTDGSIVSSLGGAIGLGTFGAATTFAGLTNDAELADLNGDGHLDLVTGGGSGGAGQVAVRMGVGDGTFQSQTVYTAIAAGAVYSTVLGDINNDGVLDIVAAGQVTPTQGYTSVFIGRGDGTFAAAVSYLTETTSSEGVQLGDLNNDGYLDMVTAGRAPGSGSGDGYMTVRLGQGNGTFGAARSYVTSETSISYEIALGDLNGDGILDVATTGDTDGFSGVTTVRFGVGDGTFGGSTSYTAETGGSRGISIVDLNNDGILDLATAGYATGTTSGYATIRLGRGDGTFGTAVSFTTEAAQSTSMKFADLNGDEFLDLVTVGGNSTPDGFMNVRLGDGSGSFAASTSYTAQGFISVGIALGDINGDGVYDAVNIGITDAFTGQFDIRLGNTTSGIQPILQFSLLTKADSLQALSIFENKLNLLSQQRGHLGAFQSRLNIATENLQTSTLNFENAANRISDSDIAHETSQLTRLSILQQSGAAVLAQANLQPEIALKLLQQ